MTGTLLFVAVIGLLPQTVVGAGSTEQVLNGAQVVVPGNVDVQSGGTFAIQGSATSPGVLTSGLTAGVHVNILTGGTFEAKFGRLESVRTLTFATGSVLRRMHDVVFTDLAGLNPGALAFVDVSALTASDVHNLAFSFNRVSFIDPQATPTRLNIKAGAATPILRCLGSTTAHGNRWGESFNTDASNRILWHTGAITRTGGATFNTLEDALKDAGTTPSVTLTVALGATAFVDDVVDWNARGTTFTAAGPILKNANLGSLVGLSVFDNDAGSGTVAERRGRLVNCIVARGGVAETAADNCTFFDPRTAAISVSNVDCRNTLIEGGFSGTGNTIPTNTKTTATTAYFSSAAGYNFHLVRTGGDAAIDEGIALTELGDFEGTARGTDGKPGGTGTWDVGADEYLDSVAPGIANITSSTANGSYRVGAVINVTVNFTEQVTLAGGNLLVALNTGVTLTIAPFGPASSASATYTVASGQNAADLTATSPLTLGTGATLRDYVGLNATLTVPSGQNLGNLKNIVVDTTAPTIANVTSTTANGSYGAGAAINITVTFSEPVILAGGNLSVTLSTGTTVAMTPFGPATTRAATYTVVAGQNSPDLNAATPLVLAAGATIKDVAGNDLTNLAIPAGQNLANLKAIVIDTTAPTLLRVTSTTPDGTYGLGASINVQVVFSEAVTLAGGNLRVALNTGITVTIAPFTAQSTVNGTYVVGQGENTNDLNATSPLTLSAGTLRDLAGHTVPLTIPTGQNIANLKAIVIKTPPLPPTNIRVTVYATAVDIEWDASPSPVSLVAGYNVYRRAPGTAWPATPLNRIAPLNGVILNTKFRDTTAAINTTYEYEVRAVGP